MGLKIAVSVKCLAVNWFSIMSAMRPIDHRRRAVSAGGRMSSERVPLVGLFPAGRRLSSTSSQISEAESKYRRWLVLSENQAEKHELVRHRLAGGIQAQKIEMKNNFVRQTKAR